ncbi:hypothetical protein [Youngiibacter multivorans]|uniref:Uncharacterized protein n=1 Tax=Youngiibacter multivorans TaxID=937251 RepID=A0ABS4G801_9CLOT|nr:hypothetical protein [Youngiibacter multivorans]MBP1920676.1 hypothetical protein [Youngiibacter multivorans]
MRGGKKAAIVLTIMAVISLTGFFIYSRAAGDNEGIKVGMITGSMLLFLAGLSFLEIRPRRR